MMDRGFLLVNIVAVAALAMSMTWIARRCSLIAWEEPLPPPPLAEGVGDINFAVSDVDPAADASTTTLEPHVPQAAPLHHAFRRAIRPVALFPTVVSPPPPVSRSRRPYKCLTQSKFMFRSLKEQKNSLLKNVWLWYVFGSGTCLALVCFAKT